MNISMLKALLNACYQAKRVHELLPALPNGVTSAYIQYLDKIEDLERQGMRAKVSDISRILNIPRPGVTRTVKEMVEPRPRRSRTAASPISPSQKPGERCPRPITTSSSPSLHRSWRIFRRKTPNAPSAPSKPCIRSCLKGGSPLNNDFTQGSILKKLSLFMLPILGALVLQAAYGAVDLLVVGQFGSTAGLSAVSTGSQVLNLVTFVVTQLAHRRDRPHRTIPGRKADGADRPSPRRSRRCVRHPLCGDVYPAGGLSPPHLCPDASAGGGHRPDHRLCAHLRRRYLLHRRL